MNSALLNDWKTRPDILNESRNMALAYLEKQSSLPPGRLIKDLEDVPLPDAGPGAMEVLQLFGQRYAHQLSNSAGPQVDRSPDFELSAPVRMNVVCFAPSRPAEAAAATIGSLLDAVRDDGRVFFTPAVYKNRPAIRAAVSNWLTTRDDAALAFSALTEVYHKWREPSPVGERCRAKNVAFGKDY